MARHEPDPIRRARRAKREERERPGRAMAEFLHEVDADLDANDRGPNGDYPGWEGTRSYPATPDPEHEAWREIHDRQI
jgi:hypothetical protein